MSLINNLPLKRIVKMHFAIDKVPQFKTLFAGVKSQIAAFEGCLYLELWGDKGNPCVFFTYSIWQSEGHLEKYRQSELFQNTWAATKILFAAPPQAWSLEQINTF